METATLEPAQANERKKVSGAIVALVIVLVVAAVLVVAWWMFFSSATTLEPTMVPSAPRLGTLPQPGVSLTPSDSTAALNQAFEGIGGDALDQELQHIDQDLLGL
jgi:hypothetical protein